MGASAGEKGKGLKAARVQVLGALRFFRTMRGIFSTGSPDYKSGALPTVLCRH